MTVVIQTGGAAEDMTPTVGFNMKKVTRGNVTIKLWDIGGQPKFRSMWERYCRGVNAVVYEFCSATQFCTDSHSDCPIVVCSPHFLTKTPFSYPFHRFVVDASDEAKFQEAKEELHQLMAKPQLANIPLLVLGNKNDLPNAVVDEEALKQLLYAQSIVAIAACNDSLSPALSRS